MTITIKKHQLFRIQEALGSLDAGYESEKGKKPFVFKEGAKVRLAAVKLLRTVEQKIEAANTERTALIKELTTEQEREGIPAPSEQSPLAPKYALRFQERYGNFLQESESIDVKPVPVSSLDLDVNPIPITTLTALEGVLWTEETAA